MNLIELDVVKNTWVKNMRSQRYKYKRHCASDSVVSHSKAGFHIHGGWYPMLTRNGFCLKPMEIYKWRNQRWWYTVNRWDWRFVTKYDKDNYTFSNMEYTKKRTCDEYILYNYNHEY